MKLNKLTKLVTPFLILTALPVVASTKLSINSAQISIERSEDGFDVLRSEKSGLKIDSFKIARLDAAPKVLKLEKVADTPDYILLDYFQGSSGTTVMKECYQAHLFQVLPNGKLFLKQKLQYKCVVTADEGKNPEESFLHEYKIQFNKKVPTLVLK